MATLYWVLTICHCVFMCVCSLCAQLLSGSVTQSCPTLCNPMDCSPSGSSVRGIFQVRILKWMPFPPPGGLFHSQGLNLQLLHWQAGSLPLVPTKKPQLYARHGAKLWQCSRKQNRYVLSLDKEIVNRSLHIYIYNSEGLYKEIF